MSSGVISLIGVFVGLILLVYLAYKGSPIVFLGPIAAIVVILISGESITDTLLGPYMDGFANFAKNNWMIFLGSAVFGKMMGDSGAAKVIAYKFADFAKKFPGKEKFMAVVSLILIGGILTMGGISLFVVVFTLVAIAKELFMELDVPWHMYTCSSLASGVITMTMLPGSPSIQNIIPTKYLGTTPMAAPALGIFMAVLACIIGGVFIHFRLKHAEAHGIGFLPSGAGIMEDDISTEDEGDLPEYSLIYCLIPSIVLLVAMNIFKISPAICLLITILVTYILFFKEFKNINETINQGGINALSAVGNTCAVVGFGSVVAAMPAFDLVIGALDKVPGPPIVQVILSVNIAAGVTGSASGGLGIALDSLGDRFIASGLDPQIIHRMATVSCGGLDSLPHNGAVINTLTVTKLGHKHGYGNYFFMTVFIPIVVSIIAAILISIGVF